MTKIFLVRHGQSEGNNKQIFLGHTDLGLTPLGSLQAEAVGDYLKGKNISAIYSSKLRRAMLTAAPLSDKISVPVTESEGIMEIYAGEWEGNTYDELLEKFPKTYGVWMKDIGNSVCDGGESIADVQKRGLAALRDICEKNDGKNIAVVSHGGCIRSMMCHFYGKPLSEMKNIPWVSNASVTMVNYDNGRFEIEKADITDHLEGLMSRFPANI